MRRTPVTRWLTGLWAVWLGVAIAEPAALHSCPVHGGTSVGHAAHAAHASAEAGHAPHAVHTSHGAPEGQRHSAGSCTCLGECCAAAPAAAPAAAWTTVSPSRVVARVSAIAAHDVAPASAPKHSRPFATAPPAAL